MRYFDHGGDYLRRAVWRHSVSRFLTIAGVVTVIVGGSIVAAFNLVDGWPFLTGVGVTALLALAFLNGGFIAFRDERNSSESLKTAMHHKLTRQLDTLIRAIHDGKQLEQDIRALNQNWDTTYETRINDWIKAVDAFLRKEFPEWVERLWRESGGRELPQPNACFEVMDRGNFMERRLVQLHGMADDLIIRQEWYRPTQTPRSVADRASSPIESA